MTEQNPTLKARAEELEARLREMVNAFQPGAPEPQSTWDRKHQIDVHSRATSSLHGSK